MPSPSHYSWFHHPNNIWWAIQIIKLLIMYFSPLLCYLVPLRPNIPLSTLSNIPYFIRLAVLVNLNKYLYHTSFFAVFILISSPSEPYQPSSGNSVWADYNVRVTNNIGIHLAFHSSSPCSYRTSQQRDLLHLSVLWFAYCRLKLLRDIYRPIFLNNNLIKSVLPWQPRILCNQV